MKTSHRLALAIPATILPATTLAHPGHGIAEQVHGLLHGEHVLMLLGIGVAALFIHWIRSGR